MNPDDTIIIDVTLNLARLNSPDLEWTESAPVDDVCYVDAVHGFSSG